MFTSGYLAHPLRVMPTYLAVGAPRSRLVFAPCVASKLMPTPRSLVLSSCPQQILAFLLTSFSLANTSLVFSLCFLVRI